MQHFKTMKIYSLIEHWAKFEDFVFYGDCITSVSSPRNYLTLQLHKSNI